MGDFVHKIIDYCDINLKLHLFPDAKLRESLLSQIKNNDTELARKAKQISYVEGAPFIHYFDSDEFINQIKFAIKAQQSDDVVELILLEKYCSCLLNIFYHLPIHIRLKTLGYMLPLSNLMLESEHNLVQALRLSSPKAFEDFISTKDVSEWGGDHNGL